MLRRGSTGGNRDDAGRVDGSAVIGDGLGAVLTLSFLASLSTGAVNNGVFFIAKEAHGFGPTRNLALGLVMGAVYVPAALAIGPGLRRLAARRTEITTRRVLAGLMLVMAALCVLPVAAPGPSAIWLFAILYIPLMGALWPIVEAYLSGGRRRSRLRRAIGRFNLTWAAAVALAAWAMAPMLSEGRPLGVFLGLAGVHIACLWPVLRMTPEPARHVEIEHEPHPGSYLGLLRCFRWLLVLSYILLAALTPILPWRLSVIGVALLWQTPVVSSWMVSRLVVFWLLQRWGGWHGRWRTPMWAAGLMVAGYAVVLLAGSVWGVVVGLGLFGFGIGAVYTAGLYYAMEVGAAEVDAAGKHEAMIGLGYGAGPLLGLAAQGLSGVWEGVAFGPMLAWLSVAVCGIFVALAAASGLRAARPHDERAAQVR